MDILAETHKKTGGIHHAYVIEGERSAALGSLVSFLENELGFKTRGNPDYWQAEFETFGIDEGRLLAELQAVRPIGGERKVFVFAADSITHEAQNSLLKVFEEPTPGTHFFILMSDSDRLLPTLLSRLQVLKGDRTVGSAEAAEAFLRMNPAKRAEALKVIIDKKDRGEAERFLKSLQAVLRSRVDLCEPDCGQVDALREISKALSYIRDRSPSVKLLLEHVANITPVYP